MHKEALRLHGSAQSLKMRHQEKSWRRILRGKENTYLEEGLQSSSVGGTETLLLGWGEVQLKKKIGQNWGKCRSVCSLEEQSKHSKDAAISLLYNCPCSKWKGKMQTPEQEKPHHATMNCPLTAPHLSSSPDKWAPQSLLDQRCAG